MAAPFIGLGLKAAAPAIQHYDKVYEPVKDRVKQLPQRVKSMRGQDDRDQDYSSGDDDYYDRPRHRSSRQEPRRSRGDGRYVEESYERKVSGRAKSVGRDGYGGRGLDRQRRKYYDSDSESSRSPPRKDRRKSLGEQALALVGLGGGAAAVEHERDKDRDRERERERERRRRRDRDRDYARDDYRNGSGRNGYRDDSRQGDYRRDDRPRDSPQQDSRNRYVPAGYLANGENGGSNDGTVARRDKAGSTITSREKDKAAWEETRGEKQGSSESSSDVCSSSEDERRTKKARGKEFLTAGLAAVATIHAAQGVYKSMEARDKRHEEVAKGEISPEEARKMKNKARLQDAAAISIAALGIKGAYSEWQEVQEHREELAKQKKERAERHEKRLRKAEKLAQQQRGYGRDDYRRSEPDLGRRYRD